MRAQRQDPLEAHRTAAREVIGAEEPNAVKRLYVELGEGLYRAYADDLDAVPVLSLPETHPVVLSQMAGTTGRILDAGCGPSSTVGIGLARLPGCVVIALDLGFGSVRLARAIARREGVVLLGIVGDVEALPFRQGAFAGAVCDDTIEHLPDDHLGVCELARVVRAGGRVVLATPNRHNLYTIRAKLADRLGGRRRGAKAYFLSESHLREYTWGEFTELVRPCLRVHRRIPVGWSGSTRTRLTSALVRLPGMYRLSQMIVAVAEPR